MTLFEIKSRAGQLNSLHEIFPQRLWLTTAVKSGCLCASARLHVSLRSSLNTYQMERYVWHNVGLIDESNIEELGIVFLHLFGSLLMTDRNQRTFCVHIKLTLMIWSPSISPNFSLRQSISVKEEILRGMW